MTCLFKGTLKISKTFRLFELNVEKFHLPISRFFFTFVRARKGRIRLLLSKGETKGIESSIKNPKNFQTLIFQWHNSKNFEKEIRSGFHIERRKKQKQLAR